MHNGLDVVNGLITDNIFEKLLNEPPQL